MAISVSYIIIGLIFQLSFIRFMIVVSLATYNRLLSTVLDSEETKQWTKAKVIYFLLKIVRHVCP